jgi:hypothetical protein
VSYYHGGGVLFQLRGVPGLWHEACVEDGLLTNVEWEGYPQPAEFFRVDAVKHERAEQVRIVTADGLECARRLIVDAEREAADIREVAKLRHFRGFLDRYQIWHPFVRAPEVWQQIREKKFRRAFDLSPETELPNALFTPQLIDVLEDVPEYPAQRLDANKPFPAWGAPGWQRSASNPEVLDEDRRLQLLCEFYLRANAIQRQAVRERRSHESLYHFAHRMAIRALRRNSPVDIELGLVALSIQDLAFGHLRDRTDLHVHLLMLRRAATRIGADFSEMLERVSQLSTTYTASALRGCAGSEEPTVLPFDIVEYEDEFGPTIGWRH